MDKTISQKYTEKYSKVGEAVLQCISYPFNILGKVLVHGNYIDSVYKEENKVHNLDVLLKAKKQGIGQLQEIDFIENFCGCYFYTYAVVDNGEYDAYIISFYTKDLALLYMYEGNHITH